MTLTASEAVADAGLELGHFCGEDQHKKNTFWCSPLIQTGASQQQEHKVDRAGDKERGALDKTRCLPCFHAVHSCDEEASRVGPSASANLTHTDGCCNTLTCGVVCGGPRCIYMVWCGVVWF